MALSAAKVVVITGANGGVGYETVKVFLEAPKPYHVFLGARSFEKASTAAEALRKECANVKNTVEPVLLDVTSDESIQVAFEQVKASHGLLDVLINNAGASFDPDYLAGKVSLRECFNKA